MNKRLNILGQFPKISTADSHDLELIISFFQLKTERINNKSRITARLVKPTYNKKNRFIGLFFLFRK